jgi:hypothetical protein
MKKILFILAAFIGTSVSSFAQTDANTFGDYKVETAKAKDANIVISALKKKKEVKDMTITGKVQGVCQAKGCWMTILLSNGDEMTVKFKDYAFFMPKDCSGKTVVAHGKAFVKTTSVAELKHLAEDAEKTPEEIAKIKKPKKEIRFEADGVVLQP